MQNPDAKHASASLLGWSTCLTLLIGGLIGLSFTAGATDALMAQLQLPPHYQENMTNLVLGELAVQRQQPATARDYYLRVAVASQDPTVAKRAVGIAIATGSPQAAMTSAILWADKRPDDIEAQQIAANLLINNNNVTQALPYFEKVLTHPAPADALNDFTAALQVSAPQGQQAFVADLPTLSKKYQQEPLVLLRLALLLQQMQQPTIALQTVDQALNQRPDYMEAMALRTQLLIDNQQETQAVAYLKQQITAHPELTPLQLMYAELLIQTHALDAAKPLLQQLAQQPSTRGPALLNLAQIAIHQDDIPTAIHYLTSATKEEKTAILAAFLLGEISDYQGDYPAAITWFTAVTNGPYYLTAQLAVAKLYAKEGQMEAAREHLHHIDVSNYEEARQVLLTEVELLLQAKQPEIAFNVVDKANVLLPDDVQLLYARGLVAGQLGRYDALEADMRRVLTLDPNQIDALTMLTSLLITNKNRQQEALDYATRALSLDPKDPQVLANMGWLQFHLGHDQQALDYLQQAYTLEPVREVALQLGEVLWRLGKQQAARTVLQEALQQSPNDPLILNALQHFESRP